MSRESACSLSRADRRLRWLRRVLCASAALLSAAPASGQFFDLQGEAWTTTIGGQTYHVLDVFAECQGPMNRALIVINPAVILLDASPGATFFHAELPGGIQTSAPVCFTDTAPEWEVDTFVTIGGEQCDGASYFLFTPGFPLDFLVNSSVASTTGGWFFAPPTSGSSCAGEDLRVRLGRFTIRHEDWQPGATLGCAWTLAWQEANGGSPTQFTSLGGFFEYPSDAPSDAPFDIPGEGVESGSGPPVGVGSVLGAEVLWRTLGGWVVGWDVSGTNLEGATAISTKLPPNADPIGSADLDGDGDTDLVLTDPDAEIVWIWILQNGALSLEVALDHLPVPQWEIVGLGDTNGDGKDDIVWRKSGGANAPVRVWQMDGATIVSESQIGVSPGLEFIAIGDWNKDGRDDLLWRRPDLTLTAWLLNGTLAPTVVGFGGVPSIGPMWTVVATPDLDGDGDDDLVWHHMGNAKVSGWLVENTARIEGGVVQPLLGTNWRVATVVDIDADGDEDVVWRNIDDGHVNVWGMDGLLKSYGGFLEDTGSSWVSFPR